MTDQNQSTTQLLTDVLANEKLADADKTLLDTAKLKREQALMAAKLSVSQSESADLSYQNLVLQLALKYNLKEGDLIEESGQITRKSEQTAK